MNYAVCSNEGFCNLDLDKTLPLIMAMEDWRIFIMALMVVNCAEWSNMMTATVFVAG